MPAAAPRPCTSPGCRRLLPYQTYCPDHPPKAQWQRREAHRGNRHERGYGTAWTKLREVILIRDKGLCQPCAKADRISVATAVDHITPKSQGGTDDPGNLQGICHACHAAKTALETVGDRASAYPSWMPAPRIPVIVIVGPPCSGKLSQAKHMATSNDLVIDLHELVKSITSAQPSKVDRTKALRARNTLLASLASPNCQWSRAIVTTTAPKPELRKWWVDKMQAQLILMTTPKEKCRASLAALGLPPVRALELSHLIDAWR